MFLNKVTDAVKIYQGALSSLALTTVDTIDRTDFNSMVVSLNVGDVFGAPSAKSITAKVTHCATANGTYTDYTSDRSGAALLTITAANTSNTMEVDLQSAEKYIKIISAATYTGGSSPYTNRAVNVILGGAHTLPPA